MKHEATFDLPRNPKEYSPSDHFLQRRNERTMVDFDIIAEAIEEGEVIEVTEGDEEEGPDVCLRHEWLNSTFKVVVAPKDKLVESAYEIEG